MQPMPQIEPISRMARDHKALLGLIEDNPVFLTQRSKPVAVMVSPRDWQRFVARMEELEWREKVRQRALAAHESGGPDLDFGEVMAELEARDGVEQDVA